MKTIRIYQTGHYKPRELIELDAAASQHVGKVLRMKEGEKLTLFRGDNREFSATIQSIGKKTVAVLIDEESVVNRESHQVLHLAQGVSKGYRMELVVQKAVELGVTSIIPLLTERSVVKLDKDRWDKKRAQWQAIAISACEQSGRNQVPTILDVMTLSAFLTQCQSRLNFILDPNSPRCWRDYSFAQHPEISLLIGPEGGLSDNEMTLAQQHHFNPLRLGPRILRTETAAITAISILQAVSGDL